jgi:hypothetical protein
MLQVFKSILEIPDHAWYDLSSDNHYNPFLNQEWFQIYTEYVKPAGKTPIIFAIHSDNKETISLLPCWYNTTKRIKTLESLSNFYTPIYTPLINKVSSDIYEVMKIAISEITDYKKWDVIIFWPMDPASDAYSSLIHTFKSKKWPLLREVCFANWYQPVHGCGFEDYFKNRPSRLRNTLARKQKKYNSLQNAKIDIITQKEDVEEGIINYQSVYTKSWKLPEIYPHFIPNLIRSAANNNLLRLGIMKIDEEAVAAQFWIVCDKHAFIYKLAYDQAYKEYSPGSLLTMEMMRYVIDVDNVVEIDFLTGDDTYKQDWMDNRRERWKITAFNPHSIKGLFSSIKPLMKNKIKVIADNCLHRSAS